MLLLVDFLLIHYILEEGAQYLAFLYELLVVLFALFYPQLPVNFFRILFRIDMFFVHLFEPWHCLIYEIVGDTEETEDIAQLRGSASDDMVGACEHQVSSERRFILRAKFVQFCAHA